MTFNDSLFSLMRSLGNVERKKWPGDHPSCVSIFKHVPGDGPSRVGMGEGGRTPIHGHREDCLIHKISPEAEYLPCIIESRCGHLRLENPFE